MENKKIIEIKYSSKDTKVDNGGRTTTTFKNMEELHMVTKEDVEKFGMFPRHSEIGPELWIRPSGAEERISPLQAALLRGGDFSEVRITFCQDSSTLLIEKKIEVMKTWKEVYKEIITKEELQELEKLKLIITRK